MSGAALPSLPLAGFLEAIRDTKQRCHAVPDGNGSWRREGPRPYRTPPGRRAKLLAAGIHFL